MTPVTIRPAAASDAEALASVAATTFPLACPSHTTREAQLRFIEEHLSVECFTEYLADPLRIVLVAVVGDVMAGYTMLVGGEPHDGDAAAAIRIRPTIELSKCYVLAEQHGTGTAAALMAASVSAAAGTGAAGLWLGVSQLNQRAQRFYAKSGFERVGTKRFALGDGFEEDYVYERALSRASVSIS